MYITAVWSRDLLNFNIRVTDFFGHSRRHLTHEVVEDGEGLGPPSVDYLVDCGLSVPVQQWYQL